MKKIVSCYQVKPLKPGSVNFFVDQSTTFFLSNIRHYHAVAVGSAHRESCHQRRAGKAGRR